MTGVPMSPRLSRRPATLAATAALALTTSLLGAGLAQASPAADQPTSTPVPIATPDGMLMSYLLNAKQANPGQTRLVERAVQAAGGTVVQSWPEIGVVVAHSTRSAFRADVVRLAEGHAVESVGATRTVAVKEGTPGSSAPAARHASAGQMSTGDAQDAGPATDPRESEQWDMAMIKADQAHQVTDGSRSVLVGVLDSGIDASHPDLKPNIDAADSASCIGAGKPDTTPSSWLPTTSGHGTHVAGTIAAARNGIGIVGVAPNVRLASVKVVCDAAAGNSNYDLANKTTDSTSPDDSTPVARTINNGCHDIPTELPGVATVSALTQTTDKASYSNLGEGVIDVAAPGSRILSTWPGRGYALLSGTSMASPHVAGVLALLKSTHPDATPAQLIAMLRGEADDHACPTDTRCTGSTDDNAFYGEGIADALDAVTA